MPRRGLSQRCQEHILPRVVGEYLSVAGADYKPVTVRGVVVHRIEECIRREAGEKLARAFGKHVSAFQNSNEFLLTALEYFARDEKLKQEFESRLYRQSIANLTSKQYRVEHGDEFRRVMNTLNEDSEFYVFLLDHVVEDDTTLQYA